MLVEVKGTCDSNNDAEFVTVIIHCFPSQFGPLPSLQSAQFNST